ncbi:MAG: hypothetical protein SGILL_006127 [Bacillariaceae sp.]
MSRQFSWYKTCIKEKGKPWRKKNSVRRECPKSMQEDDAINGNPLYNCIPTESVELVMTTAKDGGWTLRALDGNGKYKTVGGDEFYVVYHADATKPTNWNQTTIPTAVALVKDNQDGSYSLDFVTHSCSIGKMHQPTKDGWSTGGAMNVVAVVGNLAAAPPMEAWQSRLQHRGGVIRNPTSSSNSNTTSPITSLSKYDKTIFFGDSLIAQMILSYTQPLEWFHPSQTTATQNIDTSLTLDTLETVKVKLKEMHGPMLQRQHNLAIVIGSAAWDVLHPSVFEGADFYEHLQACRLLVEYIRKAYPSVAVFWRLPTAMLVHQANPDSCFSLANSQKKGTTSMFNNPCVDILRYASTSRIEDLYMKQSQLMLEELNVPVIDLYELSYLTGHALRSGDALHYSIDWNRNILAQYLYLEKAL